MENYLLLVVIPNLDCFLGSLGIIGVIFCLIAFIVCFCQYDNAYSDEDKTKVMSSVYRISKYLGVCILMFLITCFIPTKKDMIQLKAISIISELKGVEQIPQKVVDRLNDLLDTAEKLTDKEK